MGEYFDSIGVCYISVIDNINTSKGTSILGSMHNLFNEYYAKYYSQKVRNVFKRKVMSGEFSAIVLPYSEEYKAAKVSVSEMQTYLRTETDKIYNLQRFIQKFKQIAAQNALMFKPIYEFVDCIVVYASRYLEGKRVQIMYIYQSVL